VLAVHRCSSFGSEEAYLSADVRIECAGSRYRALVVYASVMVVMVPIGFPLSFFFVLWRHRRSLYPMNRDRCVRVAHSPDGTTPCYVAGVEAEFLAKDRADFHVKMQQLGSLLLPLSLGTTSAPLQGALAAPAPRQVTLATNSSGSGLATPSSAACRSWDALPGPGAPALQRSGEAMFHYALPPSSSPAAIAAVEAVVNAWHTSPCRYDAAADLKARQANLSVQHLTFLYEVWAGDEFLQRHACICPGQ
jgi:hypothetical protein